MSNQVSNHKLAPVLSDIQAAFDSMDAKAQVQFEKSLVALTAGYHNLEDMDRRNLTHLLRMYFDEWDGKQCHWLVNEVAEYWYSIDEASLDAVSEAILDAHWEYEKSIEAQQ